MNDSDTIFDKIIKREIPADIVYEDNDTLAFLDIHPNNIGHTLVIPKAYSKNIFDIPDDSLEKLALAVKKVAKAVKEGVNADGVNIAMNNEGDAGQVVFHTHIHIIPRFKGDGFKFFPTKEYAPGEAETVAEKIRSKLS